MYARMRACARGILMLLSNNTSILSNNTSIIIFIPMLGINNTTGRFFILPVVFINSGIVFDHKIIKKLVNSLTLLTP